MRIERIGVGDIVKACIKGRTVYGAVREIADGSCSSIPSPPPAGWRHASAHEITGHWRKTGRGTARNESELEPPPREQLSLPSIHG